MTGGVGAAAVCLSSVDANTRTLISRRVAQRERPARLFDSAHPKLIPLCDGMVVRVKMMLEGATSISLSEDKGKKGASRSLLNEDKGKKDKGKKGKVFLHAFIVHAPDQVSRHSVLLA